MMMRQRHFIIVADCRKQAATTTVGALKGKGLSQATRQSLSPIGAPCRIGAPRQSYSPLGEMRDRRFPVRRTARTAETAEPHHRSELNE
jgi:hypothetical protein